jgi:hypothetical protein
MHELPAASCGNKEIDDDWSRRHHSGKAIPSPVNVVVSACLEGIQAETGLRIRRPVMLVACDEKRATIYKPQLRSNTSTQLVSSSPFGKTIPSIKPGSLRRSSADLDHECFFIVRLTAVLQRNGDSPNAGII